VVIGLMVNATLSRFDSYSDVAQRNGKIYFVWFNYPSTPLLKTEFNRMVVISTVAQRNGEIYLGRFCFAEPSGSQLRCTPLEMTVPRKIFIQKIIFQDDTAQRVFNSELRTKDCGLATAHLP